MEHPYKGEWKRIFNKLNLDKPYCQEFKAQLDQYKNVRQAYDTAVRINQAQNTEYGSYKSTSIGHKNRVKASKSSSSQEVSTASIASASTTSEELLMKFKDETQL